MPASARALAMTDEEAAAFLIEDSLIMLGMLALHEEDRGRT